MKKVLILIFTCISLGVNAQSPSSFNYQAIVRDDAGELLASSQVSLKLSILEGSEQGTVVYSETHVVTSDENGLISLEIGSGAVLEGVFETISWGENAHYLKTEFDITGGSNFTFMGVSKLNSVPYALYADRINPDNMLWSKEGDDLFYNGGFIGIGTDSPEYELDVHGNINADSIFMKEGLLVSSPWDQKDVNIYYNDGYVGLGTDTPGHILEVNVDANGDDGINRQFISVRNVNNSSKSYSAVGLASGTDANKSDGAVGVTSMGYTSIPDLNGMTYLVNNENGVVLRAKNTEGQLRFWTGGDGESFERMTIDNLGNVGISNTNPNYKLDVSGTVNASEYLINGSPLEINSIWSNNGSDVYYNDGYVGLGTDTPGHILEVNVDANGDDGINRQFISVRNVNNSSKSYSAVGLASGTDANKSDGAVGVTSMGYTSIPNLTGMTYLVNNENGVAIRARDTNGRIKFWTGGDGASFERMTISNTGNIGISNTDPKSKLQVTDGDVYIDQIGNGVIMKSPDGNCWRMTVDNSGNPVFSAISCPN